MSQWNNLQSSQEEVTREERKRLAHGWDGGKAKEEREEDKEERKEKGFDKEGTIGERDQEQQFLVSVPWSHKTRCITLSVRDKKGGMAAVTAAEIVEAVLGMDNLMTEAPRIKSGIQGVDVAPMPTSAMLIECGPDDGIAAIEEGKEGGRREEGKEGGREGGKNGKAHVAAPVQPAYLDLETFASAEALESLGLDRLKAALLFWGVKCGGTLQERAQRLWRLKGVKEKGEIDAKLLAKA
ncbi:hypothetical protein NSK_007756 [Nannochloropsis salina CCMP1776]|uniref:SDE2/SF3A3 SAP domain-containing protein n=1 Tax=Nannochloropsis salina CCMP1776 TaxID=1027361 RepID=A0A4D9CRE6_9STRA|nr:hypothetical protein NSK_007756 [Nannochloropsis salina CCMP1776]|eukprot:TFJ81114.1 hypothetical protein NSK_007756 [Nannochloropsis salina CCMP1776]